MIDTLRLKAMVLRFRGKANTAHDISQASEYLSEAADEIVKLRRALEFYADVSKYPAPFTGGMGELWRDCGETARKALGR